MEKRPLSLFLDRTKRVSLQTQLALHFKQLVHDGVLKPGKTVPSSRELARDLQLSRNTVLQAYDRLIGEGYLESSPRRGLYVSASLKASRLPKGGSQRSPATHLRALTEIISRGCNHRYLSVLANPTSDCFLCSCGIARVPERCAGMAQVSCTTSPTVR
jgi:DNA-binding transcriptional MocR family regulator